MKGVHAAAYISDDEGVAVRGAHQEAGLVEHKDPRLRTHLRQPCLS